MSAERAAIIKEAEVELGEFLMDFAAKHKLTEVEMCHLLSGELDHTLKFLLTLETVPQE